MVLGCLPSLGRSSASRVDRHSGWTLGENNHGEEKVRRLEKVSCLQDKLNYNNVLNRRKLHVPDLLQKVCTIHNCRFFQLFARIR